MNRQILKKAEKSFLKQFPGGFQHPEMIEVGKRHKMEQITAFAKESYRKANFEDFEAIYSCSVKIITRSTLVSMFEKAKFRDFSKTLTKMDRQQWSRFLFELLHGKSKQGFEGIQDILTRANLAKWPLMTAIPAYYKPKKEVFVKPTTAKLIIKKLELDLEYKPKPSWEFYRKFRKEILLMQTLTDESLSPSTPAYCGFLMTSLEDVP